MSFIDRNTCEIDEYTSSFAWIHISIIIISKIIASRLNLTFQNISLSSAHTWIQKLWLKWKIFYIQYWDWLIHQVKIRQYSIFESQNLIIIIIIIDHNQCLTEKNRVLCSLSFSRAIFSLHFFFVWSICSFFQTKALQHVIYVRYFDHLILSSYSSFN